MALKPHLALVPRIKVLLATLLLLGVFFRFANLDSKVYWHDEAYTSLHLSGYSVQELKQGLFNGQLLTVDDIQQYQRLNPDRTVADTVTLLATYDAQHPPLYYVLLRLSAGLLGDSVASTRGISALLSLLSLPFAYWLGWELFQSSVTASFFTGLIAISPFHILYAQEAREYGLWIAMTLFASAALLKAMRKSSRFNWFIYAISLILGLYTFLFTALVMVAHGSYVVIMQRFRVTKVSIGYALATLASCIFLTPWLINLFDNSSRVISSTAWLTEPRSLPGLVKSWIADASRVFVDFNLGSADPLVFSLPILACFSIFIGYSIFFLCRKAPTSVWLFVVLLGGCTILFMIMPDVLFGGHRSTISRYLIPTWLSIQLAAAYWMGSVIELNSASDRRSDRRLEKAAIALIFSASLGSNIVSMKADTWWTKYGNQYQPETARIINRAEQPLVVSSDFFINEGDLLSLSHDLNPEMRVLLVREPTLPQIPRGFSEIFLFNPSESMREGLEANGHRIELIYGEGSLWKIV